MNQTARSRRRCSEAPQRRRLSRHAWIAALILLAACTVDDPFMTPPEISAFSASPDVLSVGAQPVTLSWSVTGAESLLVQPDAIDVSGRDQTTVYPSTTTTYRLIATNVAGQRTRLVVVWVDEDVDEDPPVISSFSADPGVVAAGGSVTLSWSVSGADAVRLDPGNVDVTGLDEWTVSPDATTTYMLTATSAYGQAKDETVVTVEGDPQGDLPVITEFSASPATVTAGTEVTLSWSVSDATSLRIEPGGLDVTGQSETSVSPGETTTYTLTAENAYGQRSRDTVVTVSPSDGGEPPPFSVLIAGQSNAVGQNLGKTAARAFISADVGVRMLGNDDVWKPASEPVDDCENQVDVVSRDCTAGVSYGVSLGNGVVRATGGEVLLIPAAKGGSDTVEWFRQADPVSRSTLFGNANHRARLAGSQQDAPFDQTFGGAPYGVVTWFQGESETSSLARTNAYFVRTDTVFDAFEDELGAPIIFAQLSRRGPTDEHPGDPTGAERNLLYQRVRETQRRMAEGASTLDGTLASEQSARRHLVVTHDLPMSDGRHLSAEAQVELGRRFSLAIRQHLLGEPIDGSGPRLVKVEQVSDTVVRVVADRAITAPAATNAQAYSGYFVVIADDNEVPVQSIELDPDDAAAVRITLAQAVTMGTAAVRYMPPPGLLESVALDVIRSASCDEPMPNTNACLPMPAFGSVTTAAASSALRLFEQFDDVDER